MSRHRFALFLLLLLVLPGAPAAHAAAGPAPLSRDASRPSIASAAGSGAFGRWEVDRFGLPAYRYTLDQDRDPRAQQPETGNRIDAWSQVGNDAIVAAAFNHGYTQLWSQARVAQWANRYDAAGGHYAGGFGYLRAGGKTSSTLYADRAPSAAMTREFGVGYARTTLRAGTLAVDATVTAPFGDDQAVVHEVTLRNPGDRARRATWFEYWDVNPYDQEAHRQRGLGRPVYDRATRTLRVAQAPTKLDRRPLSVFLAAAGRATPVKGYETDARAFFGAGTRALPAAVRADTARGSRAPAVADGAVGRTLLALRSPVTVPAHGAVTLRYVYGLTHPAAIAPTVRHATRAASTWSDTARRWAAWVPRADLGASRRGLSRELVWNAYQVRSSSMWEEACGHHVITQGGYYQYGLGQQLAYRDPLQHLLPMVHADPDLAREVLLYSMQLQDPKTGEVPYGVGGMCRPVELGRSNDMDFWLMLAASEYVLATRDTAFLRERVPYAGRRSAGTVMDHLRLAVRHQEAIGRGPGGQYAMTVNGDWSDFSTLFIGLGESTLVTAQLAYVYPLLAEVAHLGGDGTFATQLRALGARNLAAVRGEWTGGGWYSRGYRAASAAGAGTAEPTGTAQPTGTPERAGTGVLYAEPQPWALLAGAPDAAQATTLVGNVRRYLDGVGAPGGPSRIGASMSPSTDDPGVTERTATSGVGDRNAVYVGGTWFALNGPLTWALGRLAGTVPGAAALALDQSQRNTLQAHATAFPDHWDGILDVDDACRSFYSTAPERCGIDILLAKDEVAGHVTHQPAWTLFSTLRLAGIQPTGEGYDIAPSLPLRRWSVRLPRVGIATGPRELRGYIRPVAGGRVTLTLRPPGLSARTKTAAASTPTAWAGGHRTRLTRTSDGAFRLTLTTHANRATDWALRW